MKRPRIRTAWLMAAIVVASVAFTSLRYASAPWAATALMSTLGVLAWAILASVYRRGAARAFCLGFAVFGWIYLALTTGAWWTSQWAGPDLPTSRLTSGLYAFIEPPSLGGGGQFLPKARRTAFLDELFRDPDAADYRKVRDALEQPVSMPFVHETALEDVINYIMVATRGPGLPDGLRIYVDPVGLTVAEKTMASPITLNLDGVPLRTSLTLLLKQLDLTYRVEGRVLTITSDTTRGPVVEPDALQRIGHCCWAWLLGVLGGCAGVSLRATAEPSSGRGTTAGG